MGAFVYLRDVMENYAHIRILKGTYEVLYAVIVSFKQLWIVMSTYGDL